MNIKNNIEKFTQNLPSGCRLIAVSKTQPVEKIQEAYAAGQRLFGENKAQELTSKYETLPKDIEWHMIGHLQSNKVKYIVPFVHLIHSIDSLKLLVEVDKQAKKVNRVVDCLLQIHIAAEDTKFGFSESEVLEMFQADQFNSLKNIRIQGLMGMATLTDNQEQIRKEFKSLKALFDKIKVLRIASVKMQELSMGMSSDYKIAMEEGSTLIRVGTAIFGERPSTGSSL
jgi:pyridoxal phosphate enzyme (YggS family)